MTLELQNLWPTTCPVTVRASAVLLGASAYDAAPTEFPTASVNHIQFFITYTRAGAGGAVSMRVELSPYSADIAGVEDWFRHSCVACGQISSGADTTQSAQRATVVYGSTGAGAETFVWPAEPLLLGGMIERMRVACAETGAAGTPGTVHIVAVMA